jgi:hypothetical protein
LILNDIFLAPAIKPANPIAAPLVFLAKNLGSINMIGRIVKKNDLKVEDLCTSQDVINDYLNDPLVVRAVFDHHLSHHLLSRLLSSPPDSFESPQ